MLSISTLPSSFRLCRVPLTREKSRPADLLEVRMAENTVSILKKNRTRRKGQLLYSTALEPMQG